MATYHTAHNRLLPFLNTPFDAIQLPPILLKSISPVPPAGSDSTALFQDQSATAYRSIGPHCSDVLLQETILTSLSRVANHSSYLSVNNRHFKFQQNVYCIYDCRERFSGLSPIVRNLMEENLISNLSSLDNLKDTRDRCSVVGYTAVCGLADLLSGCGKEIYGAYTANGICIDADHYHGTWPLIINALNQWFLTKNMLQNTHNLVTRATARPEEEKPELQSLFAIVTTQSCPVFIAIKRVNYYVHGVKPATCK